MTPLEAVIFDLDDTLHDDTRAYRGAAARVAHDVARQRGAPEHLLLAAYIAQAEKFWSGLSSATLGVPLVGLRAEMWHAALRETGIEDRALAERCGADYNRYRRDLLELWPGAFELLHNVRKRGCKLALITNGFAETHREKIAILQLEPAFDEIFIADEVGLVKPDPRLFRLAAERLRVVPQACAMVGDRFDRDVRGGHAVGMYTVWLNVRNESLPAGDVRPDAVVRRIDEVEAVLPFASRSLTTHRFPA